MAIKLAEAFIAITGRTTQFDRDIDRTQGMVAAKVRTLQGMLAGITAAAAAASGSFALANIASDAEETASKFETVFSRISDDANRMALSLRSAYGLGRTESKRLLADTADLLSGFGFTQESALDLSSQVQKLAVDLASFTNVEGGAQAASAALTKALLGERESVKSLGIAILEEDVKKRVALNTAQGLTFETERQAKAYATLQIAQEQSKNAIGDYARTSDSAANIMKLVRTRVIDAAESMGKIFLPAIRSIGPLLASSLERFTELNATLGGVPAAAALAIGGLAALKAGLLAYNAVTGSAIGLTNVFSAALIATGFGAIIPIVGAAVVGIGKLVAAIVKTEAVQNALAASAHKFSQAWQTVKETVTPIFNSILSVINKALGITADSFSGTVAVLISGLAEFVLDAAEWFRVLVTNWRTVWEIMKETVKAALTFTGNLFLKLPEIVAFSMGRATKFFLDAIRVQTEAVRDFIERFGFLFGGLAMQIDLERILPESAIKRKLASIDEAFAKGLGGAKFSEAVDFGVAESAVRIAALTSDLVRQKAELEGERKSLVKAAAAGADTNVKIEREVSINLKSGFLGFADLNKRIQEALFKKEGQEFQVRTANATEATRDATEATRDATMRMAAALERIEGKPATEIAIANP